MKSIGNNFDLGLCSIISRCFQCLSSFAHVSLKEYNATFLGQMHKKLNLNTLYSD